MEFNAEIISQLFVLIAILVALVNIITELVKYTFELKNAKIINIFVVAISEVLTLGFLFAYSQIKQLQISWFIIAGSIVMGLMVAYAAMFGYDKLISYFKDIKNENK